MSLRCSAVSATLIRRTSALSSPQREPFAREPAKRACPAAFRTQRRERARKCYRPHRPYLGRGYCDAWFCPASCNRVAPLLSLPPDSQLIRSWPRLSWFFFFVACAVRCGFNTSLVEKHGVCVDVVVWSHASVVRALLKAQLKAWLPSSSSAAHARSAAPLCGRCARPVTHA